MFVERLIAVSSRAATIGPDREADELVTALRAQDPAVARRLWQRFAPMLFRILRCTLGPHAPIDDAVQVVLLCVFRRGRRLRPRADLRQLVLKVTARIAQGELRRRPLRWLVRALRPRAAWSHDLSRAEAESVLRFYRILDRLSARDRVAFVFHHVEGLDVREVGSAIGASHGETSRRLRRGLQKVADGIERDRALRVTAPAAAAR